MDDEGGGEFCALLCEVCFVGCVFSNVKDCYHSITYCSLERYVKYFLYAKEQRCGGL